eukprot:CAMPEP_0197434278 /NCGR_PEP_ID=MMETSP1175-20131217/2027_1 /TAXON_ID=1003142 /ORGANISM="Triceratium dubium, Strain CCMP147" /LENGTH=550 /DNA_ID=CAMNT_0042962935 /DNA_START=230 /DNA_END=1882 /DNA_ORIENTATION=+
MADRDSNNEKNDGGHPLMGSNDYNAALATVLKSLGGEGCIEESVHLQNRFASEYSKKANDALAEGEGMNHMVGNSFPTSPLERELGKEKQEVSSYGNCQNAAANNATAYSPLENGSHNNSKKDMGGGALKHPGENSDPLTEPSHQLCFVQQELSRGGHDRGSTNSEQQPELANVTVVRSLDIDVPATFPQKLMEILSSTDHTDIISWLPHGRGFVILQKRRFASEVLPRYFRQSKYTSFTRKLNRWGFRRVTRGPEAGAYYHELFQRDHPGLCLRMSCYTGVKSPHISSVGNVVGTPYGAAAITGVLPQIPGFGSPTSMHPNMQQPGLNNAMYPSTAACGDGQAQASSMLMQQQMHLQQLQQQRQQQEMQKMKLSREGGNSPIATTEAQLHQQYLNLQAFARAKAETESIRQAMRVPSHSGGNQSLLMPAQMQSSSSSGTSTSFGQQQHSFSPALSPVTKGGIHQSNSASSPSPALTAHLEALRDRQAAQIEALRRKAAGDFVDLNFDAFKSPEMKSQFPPQQGFSQNQQGGPRRSDAMPQHKKYRASAA